MKYTIQANNMKCNGCANSIRTSLLKINGISEVEVNLEESIVEIETEDESKVDEVKSKLSNMGYPEGDSSFIQDAKSYVSCMIGRVKGD